MADMRGAAGRHRHGWHAAVCVVREPSRSQYLCAVDVWLSHPPRYAAGCLQQFPSGRWLSAVPRRHDWAGPARVRLLFLPKRRAGEEPKITRERRVDQVISPLPGAEHCAHQTARDEPAIRSATIRISDSLASQILEAPRVRSYATSSELR